MFSPHFSLSFLFIYQKKTSFPDSIYIFILPHIQNFCSGFSTNFIKSAHKKLLQSSFAILQQF